MHHVWHRDLTLLPTAAGLWVQWFHSRPLGWPFAYRVAGVVDQFSRAPVKAFKQHPSAREVRRFVRSGIRVAGRAPEHLITDRGVQFRAEYRAWCERLVIQPRWGDGWLAMTSTIVDDFGLESDPEEALPGVVQRFRERTGDAPQSVELLDTPPEFSAWLDGVA